MFAFLAATTYRYQAFLKAENQDIYRVWFDGGELRIEKSIPGDVPYEVTKVLNDQK